MMPATAIKRTLGRLWVGLKWTLLVFEVTLILVLVAGLAVGAMAFNNIKELTPDDDFLQNFSSPAGTKIWSDDHVLLAQLAIEHREPVKYQDIPIVMRQAIVAIEDERFFSHHGLDPRGIARAAMANLTSGDLTQQGASTITQQLARNLRLSPRKTLTRKLRETLLAIQIERTWTKPKILETYLNQVYFGAGAYGVQAASQVYFEKKVQDLSLAEAALLAGLPQRPSELNPYRVRRQDPKLTRCLARRNAVLERMVHAGDITRAEADKAKAEPIKLAHQQAPHLGGYLRAKYFVDYVVKQLFATYGEDMVMKGGLQVRTTLNWKMQRAAEAAARRGWKAKKDRYRVGEVALISLDPHTGYIRAMVGGVSHPWSQQQFNCATQAQRQPGSSFKFFVYGTALEAGWRISRPIQVAFTPMRDGDKTWVVHNHGAQTGTRSMLSAFAGSINTCAVNTILAIGPGEVVEFAHRLGIKSHLTAVPSLALGSSEVNPLEMAAAYGTIAAGGKRAEPMSIVQVTAANGETLMENTPTVTQLKLSPRTIRGLTRLTRAVVTSGTGRAARGVPDAHGKTGTTDDYKDTWFIGFTPRLATAVWAGNLDNKPTRHGFGGTIAAPIWADYMKQAVKLNPEKSRQVVLLEEEEEPEEEPDSEKPAINEPQPRRSQSRAEASRLLRANEAKQDLIRVKVCSETGLLATKYCPHTSTDQYFRGAQPTTRCTVHTAPQPGPAPTPEPPPEPDADE